MAAARAAGARRFVAQGFAGWPYASDGPALRTEDDPFEPSPPEEMRSTVDALRHLESVVLGARDLEGTVLRYGGFYGSGTSLGEGGAMVEAVRKRQLPIVGDGAGESSLIHIADAAAATVVALERGGPGVYNLVDDDPAPASEWIPELAKAVGAKPPRRLPVWLVKPLIGEAGVWLMTKAPGASNAKAKAEPAGPLSTRRGGSGSAKGSARTRCRSAPELPIGWAGATRRTTTAEEHRRFPESSRATRSHATALTVIGPARARVFSVDVTDTEGRRRV